MQTYHDHGCAAAAVPAEFDCLLREIEREKVPQRILRLALELQRALEQRCKGGHAGA